MLLHDLLTRSARDVPDRVAVRGPEGPTSYRDLDALGNRLARALSSRGVVPGDRVGIHLDKSAMALATMQACLRLGAAYVPLDPRGPLERTVKITREAQLRLVVTSDDHAQRFASIATLCPSGCHADELETLESSELPPIDADEQSLAYILFTSGSTGIPKGVCISHRNALAFVNWAVDHLGLSCDDRLANHAPLHFDLSVLDIYGAFHCGASVHLLPELLSYVPTALVEFLEHRQITIVYAVPSILTLMIDDGGLLTTPGLAVRTVVFAGEPFALPPLRALRAAWPNARLFNFYGPTETNVCTSYEVKAIDPSRRDPVPIGTAASGDHVWAERPDGTIAQSGEEGELVATGPTVMLGYWGHPPVDGAPYRTGDIVRVLEDGGFEYVGRRDRMLKVRGQRVELGEIEATLLEHPEVRECAVVPIGRGDTLRLHAFVVARGDALPLLELRRHCATHLPAAWSVNAASCIPSLPLTRNGKIDRRALQRRAQETSP